MVEPLSNVIRVLQDSPSASSRAFLVLQLIGFSTTFFTLLTAVISSRKRHLTWYNFMLSWFIYCSAYLLLFFSGKSSSENIPFALCLIQSAMVHTTAPYASSSSLALVTQLFFNVYAAVSGRLMKYQRCGEILILALPYVVLSTLMLVSVLLGLVTPRSELQFKVSAYQCTANSILPGRLAAGLTVTFALSVLIVNAVVYYLIRKHWTTFQASSLRRSTSMIIRASLFSLFGLIAVIAGLVFFFVVFIRGNTSKTLTFDALNLILALFPIAVIVIFGTHSDLLGILLFWRKRQQTTISGTGTASNRTRPTITITSATSNAEPVEFVCMVDVAVSSDYEKDLEAASRQEQEQEHGFEPESLSYSSFPTSHDVVDDDDCKLGQAV